MDIINSIQLNKISLIQFIFGKPLFNNAFDSRFRRNFNIIDILNTHFKLQPITSTHNVRQYRDKCIEFNTNMVITYAREIIKSIVTDNYIIKCCNDVVIKQAEFEPLNTYHNDSQCTRVSWLFNCDNDNQNAALHIDFTDSYMNIKLEVIIFEKQVMASTRYTALEKLWSELISKIQLNVDPISV
jgi:hypothetical protein